MKSILASKTFWINLIALALTITAILPPKYGVPGLAILNVLNRFFTSGPVNLTGK